MITFPRINVFVLLALMLPAFANAAGLYFLADAPIAKFTEQDHKIFKAATEQALESVEDGDKLEWKNPDSGARGVITILETTTDNTYGLCRMARVSNEAKSVRRMGIYRACKPTNGTWRLLSAGE